MAKSPELSSSAAPATQRYRFVKTISHDGIYYHVDAFADLTAEQADALADIDAITLHLEISEPQAGA